MQLHVVNWDLNVFVWSYTTKRNWKKMQCVSLDSSSYMAELKDASMNAFCGCSASSCMHTGLDASSQMRPAENMPISIRMYCTQMAECVLILIKHICQIWASRDPSGQPMRVQKRLSQVAYVYAAFRKKKPCNYMYL